MNDYVECDGCERYVAAEVAYSEWERTEVSGDPVLCDGCFNAE